MISPSIAFPSTFAPEEIQIADLFCGAGGTSSGAVEAISALGKTPVVTAVNHWPIAIDTHTANHPHARHFCTGIDNINPTEIYKDSSLHLLWASPECTHHSIARGGMPINDQSRATAWCVVRWAEKLLPPVILVENVPEFQSWGPIGSNGRPLPSKKGQTFNAWLDALRSLGYKVDYKVLCAADFGDPTTRSRLFIQAVRGRRKIVWPNRTHTKGADLFATRRWTPARDIIDWSLQGQSIYDRKKALSPKTMARIEAGLRKYGIKEYICAFDNGSSSPESGTSPIEYPISTIVTKARHGVAEPFLVELRGSGNRDHTAKSLDQPCGTVTANGNHHAIAQPFLVKTANGESRSGEASRSRCLDQPMPTICGNRGDVALISPYLLPQQSCGALRPVSEPAPTVATSGAIALVVPELKRISDATATSLPVVEIAGVRYLLDIRFRMLQPHELALAQGFPKHYLFTGNKSEQVKQIGNAVPRRLARALVAATITQDPDVSWLVDAEEHQEAIAKSA